MPSCVKCGKRYVCKCTVPSSLSTPVVDCPLKKGAIWVHVVNDLTEDVKDVPVTVNGQTKPTDKHGIATFDPLDPVDHPVDLDPLGVDLLKIYDQPSDTAQEVSVSNGEITYVAYELKRKPWSLKVTVKSIFGDLWPTSGVALALPSGLSAGSGTLEGQDWVFTLTGLEDVDGEVRASHADWMMKDATGPTIQLKPGLKKEVQIELHTWRLTAIVESTTAFGWPTEDVTVESEDGKVTFPPFKMTAKTGTVKLSGIADVDSKLLAKTVGGWTLEAPVALKLKPGDVKTETLKLKGVDIQFQLMDAATTPAPVKDEPVKILREDGKDVPRAPDKTDAKGQVELKNVPPEKYKIKFPERYDDEWEFGATEALTV